MRTALQNLSAIAGPSGVNNLLLQAGFFMPATKIMAGFLWPYLKN